MRRRILLGVFIILLGYSLVRLGVFVFAEQHGSTPESSSTSHLKTLYDSLVSSSFGSESAGAWGDWGTMWNRIYSAITWTPSGDASPSDVASGKTFYASSRILQTGQGSLQPTPAPVTPAVGDASRLNTIYKAVKTISYGAETSGAWGDWGSMWNRIYSAASWTASSANAAVTDVLSGKTFYSGATRNQLTGTSLASGVVCVNNSDCFTGTCTTFYQDSDSDTYGNSSASTKRCGATYTVYVTNSTDCYDSNGLVYPGSTTCSTTNRGDGSYDYNCNGAGDVCGTAYYSVSVVTALGRYCCEGCGKSCDPCGTCNVIGGQVGCGANGNVAGGSATCGASSCAMGWSYTVAGTGGTQACQ